MNTMESKEPSRAAASERPLDHDMWLDTALEGTFPASDPIATFRSDGAIFIPEAHATTPVACSTTTPAVDPTAGAPSMNLSAKNSLK
jgi:hypothetical protein